MYGSSSRIACYVYAEKGKKLKEFAADIFKEFHDSSIGVLLQQYLHVIANTNSSDLNASIVVFFRFCGVLLFSYVC